VSVGNESEEAHDEEHGTEATETDQVESSATDTNAHQEPCAEYTSHVDTVLSNCEIHSLAGIETGLFKEISRVTRERVAAQVLDSPDHTDNLGTAKIGSLEAVPVAGASRDLLLELGGVNHHINGFIGIKVSLAVQASQAKEGCLSIFNSTLSDQPPRTLGSKGYSDEKRDRPHPLESVRNAVCPLIIAVKQRLHNTNTNSLTHSPAEVDVGCKVSAKSDRADFGSVGYGKGLENAPWNTAENLSNQQGLDVLCGEEDGSDSGDHDQASHDSVAVAEALRDETVDEETDDFSNIGSVAETCLPACGYLVCSIGQHDTIFLIELGVGVEGTKKTDVVTFHSDTGRDEDTPEDGLGIQLDALQEGHVVFLLSGKFGICDGQVVGLGMGELILLGEGERFLSNFRHGE